MSTYAKTYSLYETYSKRETNCLEFIIWILIFIIHFKEKVATILRWYKRIMQYLLRRKQVFERTFERNFEVRKTLTAVDNHSNWRSNFSVFKHYSRVILSRVRCLWFWIQNYNLNHSKDRARMSERHQYLIWMWHQRCFDKCLSIRNWESRGNFNGESLRKYEMKHQLLWYLQRKDTRGSGCFNFGTFNCQLLWFIDHFTYSFTRKDQWIAQK